MPPWRCAPAGPVSRYIRDNGFFVSSFQHFGPDRHTFSTIASPSLPSALTAHPPCPRLWAKRNAAVSKRSHQSVQAVTASTQHRRDCRQSPHVGAISIYFLARRETHGTTAPDQNDIDFAEVQKFRQVFQIFQLAILRSVITILLQVVHSEPLAMRANRKCLLPYTPNYSNQHWFSTRARHRVVWETEPEHRRIAQRIRLQQLR